MNHPVSPAEGSQSAAETVNVLIVDDEPANLLVLETVLANDAYRLIRANSGDEALMALIAHEFAVLVLDIHMPGISGFELAKMVKERKRTAHVPIIFLTAYYGEDQHVLVGYDTGAVDYLHKPVNPVVLRAKVAVFADLHRKTRALQAANRALQAEVEERVRAEARLNELNESLDRRVNERTIALRESEAQLLDAGRRKDEFLAILAHELRNPLAPIRSAAHLLQMEGLGSERRSRLGALLERQVRAMARLIDDLMDVSRINQGKLELRREPVAIGAVLDDAIETVKPFVDECEHELVLNAPEASVLVLADRTRLAQAFINLLHNAAKYMDRGGRIELNVRAEKSCVVVSCKDRGIGIPNDRLDAVFEMFSQVEATLSRARGGLGIGLSLTRSLIELHGGSVSASSAGLGAGSEFVVRLAILGDGENGPNKQASNSSPVVERGGSLRILLADDNEDAAIALSMLLEKFGHDVRRVGDGKAAVELAADFQPHVALLDIGMPVLDGYQACAGIRRQPNGASIGMVAVTGWGQPADVHKAHEAGFDHHLVKPVDADALQALIDKLVQGHNKPPSIGS